MPFRPDPRGMQELGRRLSLLALKGAEAGAEVLKDKLSQAGSGPLYPGQRNPASVSGEYPAMQTGALRDSIAARATEDGHAEFGPINDPPQEALLMQVLPPDQGGRYYLDLAQADVDVRDAVLKAVQDEV